MERTAAGAAPEKKTAVYETESAFETAVLAERLAGISSPGMVYALSGDLGTGKTVFSKGFGKGLGVTSPVTSPTFTLLQVYEEGRIPFYHFDVYRLGDPSEFEEIGGEDYLYGDGICLIEWPEQIEDYLPEGSVFVLIEKDLSKGTDHRKITIEGCPGELPESVFDDRLV